MLTKTILLPADAKTVWNTLFDPEKYKFWTTAFAEGSNYVGTLEKGNPIQFLDGSMTQGMQSEVADLDYPNTLVFRHFYAIMPDLSVEDAIQQAKEQGWYGDTEAYILEETDGQTMVRIEMEIPEPHMEMMSEMWDNAIELLKKAISDV
jgi:hypothetical protein